jgi:ABC-2 type transport system ATP-binding protein
MSLFQSDTKNHADPIVVVDGLCKQYGKVTAVDNLSFVVNPGETLGLLGPNGAGKTTTLSIISGLIRPDSGDVTVGGFSVAKDTQKAQHLLGVVPQGLALYEDLTAKQNLVYFARLRGLSGAEIKQQVTQVLEITGLEDAINLKVRKYSGGMKRRLNIAIGLLGNPKVLLLDEPTVGIDPQARRHILDSVRRLADSGMTIIYTSHYMEEVEYLCESVAILDHGVIIAQGPIDEVRSLAGDSVILRIPAAEGLLHKPEDLEKLKQALHVPIEPSHAELRIILPKGSAQAPEILNILVEHQVPLTGMQIEAPNLETVFLSLTGKALRDNGSEASAS